MNPITLPDTIDRLPNIFLEVKNKLQSTQLDDRFNVSGSVITQETIIKVKDLSFDPSASLLFANLSPDYIIIYAETLSLNGSSVIGRAQVSGPDGANGKKGSDGKPISSPPGAPGNRGLAGEPGRDGGSQRVPQVFIFVQKVLFRGAAARPADLTTSPFSLLFDGCPGGKGGDGGKGGNGSDGVRGAPAIADAFFCEQGPGWGGRGGDAGSGGMFGVGGNGSDGAAIRIFADALLTAVLEKITVSINPGNHGPNGRYLGSGLPGRGGKEGDYESPCGPAGRNGLDGTVFNCRPPDTGGLTGVRGPDPTIQRYTGFDELAYRDT